MAKMMDKVTLIRSMHHTMKNHNSAGYYALTGHQPPVDDIRLKETLDLYPALGSVVDRLAPLSTPEMPTSVSFPHIISDGSRTPVAPSDRRGIRYPTGDSRCPRPNPPSRRISR